MPSSIAVRYPWDEWFGFKGNQRTKEFTIKQGKDIDCQVHGMLAQIRNEATRRKVHVKITTKGDTINVVAHK